jgi:hypothetical protein
MAWLMNACFFFATENRKSLAQEKAPGGDKWDKPRQVAVGEMNLRRERERQAALARSLARLEVARGGTPKEEEESDTDASSYIMFPPVR